MKILFTGGSSFTGYWLISELARSGHEVVAIFRRALPDYRDLRRQRVEALQSRCRAIYQCAFGDDKMVSLINSEQGWDALCHHAAEVKDYKSPDFDVTASLGSNTRNIRTTFSALANQGCRRVVSTGSVFENGEGAGSEGLPAFSAYGLSKALTWQVLEFFAKTFQFHLAKFVIPNPFGPFEEPRFTDYLIRAWTEEKTASVRTPAYVRDNIHVALLAKGYVNFLEGLPDARGTSRLNPSGYIESQGSFALRFAESMRRRLVLDCQLDLVDQTEFSEPMIRINTDPLDKVALGWSDELAWDELAHYYAQRFDCEKREVY